MGIEIFKAHFYFKTMLRFLFFIFYTTAQNLVPNYGFEDTISCPNNTDELYKSKNWFNPTKSSPDFYHQCSLSGISSIPKNITGFQYALTGKAYAGISVFSSQDYREYIEIKLLDSLIGGKKYCISFNVSLANSFGYATDVLGAYLSKDSLKVNTTKNLTYNPQILNPKNKMLSDTLNWMLISDTLVALGGEMFITIGNFNADSLTNVIVVGPGNGSYYYIDDVSVIPCDSGVGIKELTDNEMKFKLYPNPNDGNMQLDYSLTDHEEGILIINDLTGIKAAEYKLFHGDKTIYVSEGALKNGIYFYHVIINDVLINCDRIIIIK